MTQRLADSTWPAGAALPTECRPTPAVPPDERRHATALPSAARLTGDGGGGLPEASRHDTQGSGPPSRHGTSRAGAGKGDRDPTADRQGDRDTRRPQPPPSA